MTRVPATEMSVSLEDPQLEPVWVASDDSGHHYWGSKNGCKDANQTSRNDNEVSRQPLSALVLIGIHDHSFESVYVAGALVEATA
jgi:hypothetical protein